MVVGGQAVLHYGSARLTNDIDITLGVGIEAYPEIKKLLSKHKLEFLVESPELFVQQTHVLPVLDTASGIRVDFIFSDSVFERRAIKRGRLLKVGSRYVRFAMPEDVIIQKIIAGRPRDIEDVRQILLKQRRLNISYIQRWLREFQKILNISLVNQFHQLSRNTKKKSHNNR